MALRVGKRIKTWVKTILCEESRRCICEKIKVSCTYHGGFDWEGSLDAVEGLGDDD